MRQLGEILLDEGLVSEAQILAAMDEQGSRNTSLGRTLVELGFLTENQLVKALAEQVGRGVLRRLLKVLRRGRCAATGELRQQAAEIETHGVLLGVGNARSGAVRPVYFFVARW